MRPNRFSHILPNRHIRDDEEEDWDDNRHLVEYEIYTYRGCKFCGCEDHMQKECPAKTDGGKGS